MKAKQFLANARLERFFSGCGRFDGSDRILVSMNDSEPPSDLSETEFLALLVKLEQGLRAFARVLVPDWDLVDESLQEASVTMW